MQAADLIEVDGLSENIFISAKASRRPKSTKDGRNSKKNNIWMGGQQFDFVVPNKNPYSGSHQDLEFQTGLISPIRNAEKPQKPLFAADQNER